MSESYDLTRDANRIIIYIVVVSFMFGAIVGYFWR